MYSRFFGKSDTKQKLSRFERCKELKPICPLLEALRLKEIELQDDITHNKSGIIAFKKHTVIAELVSNIDLIINKFNQEPACVDHYNEIEEVSALVKKIVELVTKTFMNDEKTLLLPRDKLKSTTDNVIHYSIIAAVISLNGLTIPALGLALFGSNVTRSALGLNNPIPKSAHLISELNTVLEEMSHNFRDYLSRNKIPQAIQQNKAQRTWGAIALTNQLSLFSKLPIELKSEILSYVYSGYERKENLLKMNKFNTNLLVTSEKMCRQHNPEIENDFEMVCLYTNL